MEGKVFGTAIFVVLLGLLGFSIDALAVFDIIAEFTAPAPYPGGKTFAGVGVEFDVKMSNNGPGPVPFSFSVSVNKFDQTGQQFITQLPGPQSVPAGMLPWKPIVLRFREVNPPAGAFFYKLGYSPAFTDTNNLNHKPEKFITFVTPGRLTVTIVSSGAPGDKVVSVTPATSCGTGCFLYFPGIPITIEARPSGAGYDYDIGGPYPNVFVRWSDGTGSASACIGRTDNQCSFRINQRSDVKATFAPQAVGPPHLRDPGR